MNNSFQFSIADIRSCIQFIPEVAHWHHDLWSHLNPGQTLADRIQKMQSYCGARIAEKFSPTLFVARDLNGNPIGTAALDAQDMDCFPELTPWLASVFVLPRYRNHGVATALVNHVCEVARNEMAVNTLYLFTPDQSAFYKRLGWGVKCHLNYHGEKVQVMQLDRSR